MIPIYLPELPQEKLNTLVHGLWGHETIYGGVGKAASIEIYNELFDLNKRMKEIWGGELQIEDLKLLLTEMKKTVYIKRTEILGPMRLLPLGEEFYDCKKYYQEKVYPQVTKSKIESIASKIFS